MKNICIINFSDRNNGNCANIAKIAASHYKRTKVLVSKLDAIKPCSNCDYECLKTEEVCPHLNEEYSTLMDTIYMSDLAIYVIPNYCGFPCSRYFAFNERSVGYFNGNQEILDRYLSVKKLFIIVSNTMDDYFVHAMEQQTSSEPKMKYLRTSEYGLRSIDGNMMDIESAKSDLIQFLEQHPV